MSRRQRAYRKKRPAPKCPSCGDSLVYFDVHRQYGLRRVYGARTKALVNYLNIGAKKLDSVDDRGECFSCSVAF